LDVQTKHIEEPSIITDIVVLRESREEINRRLNTWRQVKEKFQLKYKLKYLETSKRKISIKI